MTCTEEYREHIEYTFHAFCKVVIRNATINAARTRSRKHKREISLEYLTDEKHYPLGTTDEYFQAPEPDEEYILTLCGDTVIFSSGLLAEALSRLDEREREMIYLSLLLDSTFIPILVVSILNNLESIYSFPIFSKLLTGNAEKKLTGIFSTF